MNPSSFRIAHSPSLDHVLTQTQVETAAAIWRRWFRLRSIHHRVIRANESTPGYFQIELRLWGFPRNQATHVCDALSERAAALEFVGVATLVNADTVSLIGRENELSQPIPDSGHWHTLVTDPAFEGLCAQLRICVRPDKRRCRRFPHDDTLLLFGQISDGRFRLRALWALGEGGRDESKHLSYPWQYQERFVEYLVANEETPEDQIAFPEWSPVCFVSTDGPLFFLLRGLIHYGFLGNIRLTVLHTVLPAVVVCLLWICLLRSLPLLVRAGLGILFLCAFFRLVWVVGMTLMQIIGTHRKGLQGLEKGKTNTDHWKTIDREIVPGAWQHPTLIKDEGDLRDLGGEPLGDMVYTGLEPGTTAFSRVFGFPATGTLFSSDVTLTINDAPAFITRSSTFAITALLNGTIQVSVPKARSGDVPRDAGIYRVAVFEDSSDAGELLRRHNLLVEKVCQSERTIPAPISKDSSVELLNASLRLARAQYQKEGWSLVQSLKLIYQVGVRREP